MGLRPNVCYRGKHRPYTRTSKSVQRKDYITGIPGSKISQFEMGKKGGDFDTRVEIIAQHSGTIRHNTLEAMRIVASRHLQKLGTFNFFFKIPNYPHHILRENPMATGAGADRFSQGMRASFGKPIGRATQVKSDDVIVYVHTSHKYGESVKQCLKKACYKLGLKTRVEVRDMTKREKETSRQQAAKKAREAEIAEPEPTPAAEKTEEEGEAKEGTEGEKKEDSKDAKPVEGSKEAPAKKGKEK